MYNLKSHIIFPNFNFQSKKHVIYKYKSKRRMAKYNAKLLE